MNDIIEAWRERIRVAAARGTALEIRGSGSKAFYGRTPRGEPFDTRPLCGVVSYEPSELVVTARAGTPLAELEALLAAQGQMLACEPPHFGSGATVGGCVAAGLSGPRRAACGALRDFVLGVKILDGRGEVLTFGGQVMKNVAGYDVARLMAGSLGTLGVLLEVSLKVLPRPLAETSLRFVLNEAEALERLNEWAGQPLPLSASVWHDGVLVVRLSGAAAAVHAARARLGGEPLDPAEAEALWQGLREQHHPFFAAQPAAQGGSGGERRQGPDAPAGTTAFSAGEGGARERERRSNALWRVSLPSAAAPLRLGGRELIEWGGALRWLWSALPPASVRERAVQLGGHATLFRGGVRNGAVFQPLPPPIFAIHQRLKHAFDPAGIFNPGRLYEGL